MHERNFEGLGPMLKSQLIDRKVPDGGERKLCGAVLEDALRQMGLRRTRAKLSARELAEQAEFHRWIWGDGYFPMPFQFVCEALNLDHEALREAIAKLDEFQMPHKGFLRAEMGRHMVRPPRRLAAG